MRPPPLMPLVRFDRNLLERGGRALLQGPAAMSLHTSRSFQRLLTCEKIRMPTSEAKPTAENQYQT